MTYGVNLILMKGEWAQRLLKFVIKFVIFKSLDVSLM